MASLTRWTWVWASSGNWCWTGKPGVLQSMGSQRVEHDWATELKLNASQAFEESLSLETSGDILGSLEPKGLKVIGWSDYGPEKSSWAQEKWWYFTSGGWRICDKKWPGLRDWLQTRDGIKIKNEVRFWNRVGNRYGWRSWRGDSILRVSKQLGNQNGHSITLIVNGFLKRKWNLHFDRCEFKFQLRHSIAIWLWQFRKVIQHFFSFILLLKYSWITILCNIFNP